MVGTFEDLLFRADRLSSTVLSSDGSGRHPASEARAGDETCIDDIFRRSQSLLDKKRAIDGYGAKFQCGALGEQSSLWDGLGPSCSVTPKANAMIADEEEESSTTLKPQRSLEAMWPEMMRQTETLIMRDALRYFTSRVNAERAAVAVKEPADSGLTDVPPNKKRAGVSRLPVSAASGIELAFAKTLSEYVVDKKAEGLRRGFLEAAGRSRDETVISIWEQGTALLALSTQGSPRRSPRDTRSSPEWVNALVDGSVRFLQKHLMSHMRELVNRNLAVARVGGVPGTLALIDGYLNVKHLHSPKRHAQDGVFGANGHAVWEVVYHCLRCGDYGAVANVARSRIQNIPSSAAMAVALCAVANDGKLGEGERDAVMAEWKAEGGTTGDVYKKAVYSSMLGGDVPEVSDNLENWLWLKLAPFHFASAVSSTSFAALQRTISIEYGEEYFTSNGGNAAIFFEALWLTGQFERAIHLLYRSEMLVHAVHLSIMAYVNGLLITTPNGTDPILQISDKDPLDCSVNFARLVLIYVKSFEAVDVQRAMDYYFCLRDIQAPSGGSVFYACVARAVEMSGETDKVVGRVDEHGVRHEGCIDKYAYDISVNDAIAKVAANVELSAEPIKSVVLYHAAERHNDALRVICSSLANALKGFAEVDEPRSVAVWLAGICKRTVLEGCSSQLLTTLYLLIDLSTFFANFTQHNYAVCLDIIAKLQYIPLDATEVAAHISMFHTLTDEVRSLLPDVCLTVMRTLEQLASNRSWRSEVSARADAVVAYAARVPYSFPAEVTAQLLEINSRLH